MKYSLMTVIGILSAFTMTGCHAQEYDSLWGGMTFYSDAPSIFAPKGKKDVTENLSVVNGISCSSSTDTYGPTGENTDTSVVHQKLCGPMLIANEIRAQFGTCTEKQVPLSSSDSIFGRNSIVLRQSADCLCYREITQAEADGVHFSKAYGYAKECSAFFGSENLDAVDRIIGNVIQTVAE